MNRYVPRSKATPSTVCQKCLQKGHYSYECTAAVQSRPYKSRPSRTQQLLNPSLRTPLANDAGPSDIAARRKGTADAELAKLAEERGRKRQRIDGDSMSRSSSSTSVSTISTNRSASPSPPANRKPAADSEKPREGRRGSNYHHRRTNDTSTSRHSPPPDAVLSTSSDDNAQPRRHSGYEEVVNTRKRHRRRSSISPNMRGRTRSRSRSRSWERYKASRHRPRRDRSGSLDRSRIAKERRSSGDNDFSAPVRGREDLRRVLHHGRHGDEENASAGRDKLRGSGMRKERSLSPYSKRIALTQSMNM